MFKLDVIDLANSPMVREKLDLDAVGEYTESYRLKEEMPPCHVFETGGPLLLGDGRHRLTAMKAAGIKERTFIVHQGSFEDCLKFALQANLFHGLRRTNADKRIGVRLALSTFPKISNAQIAEIAAVGDDLVSTVRKEMESNGELKTEEKRNAKDGKQYPASLRKTKPAEAKKEENKGKTNEDTSPVPAEHPPVAVGTQANPSVHAKNGKAALSDETGYPIPEGLTAVWERRDEVQTILTALSKIRARIQQAFEEDDRLYTAEINKASLDADLSRAYTAIKQALPAVVCPMCQGKLTKDCTTCKERGFVSKFYYEIKVDADIKKIREASIEK